MPDNSPYQLTTELRKLRLEIAEMEDGSMMNIEEPKIPDSLSSLNTEAFKELQEIRNEFSNYKKAQGVVNRSTLEKLGVFRRKLTDLKGKYEQNQISKQTAIKYEFIGKWELIENIGSGSIPRFRKFDLLGGESIMECYCENRDFPASEYESVVFFCVENNRLKTGNRSMYIRNGKLHVERAGVPVGVYRKINE